MHAPCSWPQLVLLPPLLSTAGVVFFSSTLPAGAAGATAATQDAGAPGVLPTDAEANTHDRSLSAPQVPRQKPSPLMMQRMSVAVFATGATLPVPPMVAPPPRVTQPPCRLLFIPLPVYVLPPSSPVGRLNFRRTKGGRCRTAEEAEASRACQVGRVGPSRRNNQTLKFTRQGHQRYRSLTCKIHIQPLGLRTKSTRASSLLSLRAAAIKPPKMSLHEEARLFVLTLGGLNLDPDRLTYTATSAKESTCPAKYVLLGEKSIPIGQGKQSSFITQGWRRRYNHDKGDMVSASYRPHHTRNLPGTIRNETLCPNNTSVKHLYLGAR